MRADYLVTMDGDRIRRSAISGSRLLPVAVFLAVLAFAGWAYSLGINGGWQFDDAGSLGGLSSVDSIPSALQYILSGRAGPTGRPVALVSFALQADAWPDRPEAMSPCDAVIYVIN